MKKPNFFIVGAPKCGTTALGEYLKTHPSIFMSTPKEPHFFSEDFPRYRRVKTLPDYEALFSGADKTQTMIGEASVFYLRSETALNLIHQYNSEARVIVMLRKPVDMVYSLHSQLLLSGDENVQDFATAWKLQERRAHGEAVPGDCREPAFLQYRDMGKIGSQLQNLLKIFPTNQVMCILFDDFTASPRATYVKVLDFLGVPDDNRSDFQTINPNEKTRSDLLAKILRKIPQSLINAVLCVKQKLGIKRLGVLKGIRVANTRQQQRDPLPENLIREINQEFSKDIKIVEKVLDQKLDHWTLV